MAKLMSGTGSHFSGKRATILSSGQRSGWWGQLVGRSRSSLLDIPCNHEIGRAPRGPVPYGSDPRAPPVPRSPPPSGCDRWGFSSQALRMADVATETAYYLNSKIPALALVAKGVRFPAGMWIRVAEATVPPWQVEDMLGSVFSALRGRMLRFESFTNEEEVKEFERSL